MVSLLQPQLLILWVHRADTATASSKLLALHSTYKLVALAPHVAALAQARLKQPVSWTMPVAPFRPEQPCNNLACLRGFVVQVGGERERDAVGNRGLGPRWEGRW